MFGLVVMIEEFLIKIYALLVLLAAAAASGNPTTLVFQGSLHIEPTTASLLGFKNSGTKLIKQRPLKLFFPTTCLQGSKVPLGTF